MKTDLSGFTGNRSSKSIFKHGARQFELFTSILLLLLIALSQTTTIAQQVPFLSELLSRYEDFNRLCTDKRRAGQNVAAIEPLRKRIDEAFKRGDIPGLLEAISEGQTILGGKKWDDRQRFIASLTLEPDRLVIEPNQVLQVSLTRMFPVNTEKAFASRPTVSFAILPGDDPRATRAGQWNNRTSTLPAGAQQPLVIAERLTIAETSSNAARKLALPDGTYQVVARIEAGDQTIAQIARSVYAISNFTDSVTQMSKSIAAVKGSSDAKVKAVASLVSTPEFQLQRVAQLNKTRGEVDINPNQDLDRIEAELSMLSKGQNPFADGRGEVERAYQGSDGKLVPYRAYVPKSYDGASARPLVVMLHGALGNERYYFSGLFDTAVIKGEAERRGYILVGVNGGSRFGLSEQDAFEVINSVTRDYKIDASRVYLMGHSTGALATWLIASSKPEKFAGIAAISGGPPAQGDALAGLLEKIKGLPSMVVHGSLDGIVPVQLSRSMAASAEKAGLKVKLLEVPDGDHLSVVASTFPEIMGFFDKNSRH
jgi:pimeloyl-ACP methyl ester carboxylesterase